jgi:phosphate transport system protein
MDAPEELRRSFHDRLAELRGELTRLAAEVVAAVRRASDGFLESDPTVGVDVRLAHQRIEVMYNTVEHDAFDVVALQAPVARDLRFVMATVRIAQELERCGGLAASIARQAGVISDAGLTPGVRAILHELGAEAVRLLDGAARAYGVLDTHQAAEVVSWASVAADLHGRLLTELYGLSGVPPRDLVELGLISRFYRRLADHAVKVADRVVFVVGG